MPLTLCLLAGCQPAEEGAEPGAGARPTLYYFTWSDYVDQAALDEFERETGARVVADTFGSNEELLAKLQSGAPGYDVAVPSDFMVSILIKLGLLAELDPARIPNATRLVERLQTLPFDPEHRYSVPYLWGTVGIGYDARVVERPPESWTALWDPRYKGRISMLNDQREVLGVALHVLGYSQNSRNPAAIDQASRKLLEQKPLVKTYTSENYDQLLASGEVVLAHGWGGAVARAMAERPSIRYALPREGATIWADCLVVLKTSRNRDLAMRLINHLLDRRVAARTTERLLFASANRDALPLVRPDVRDNPAVYPTEADAARLEWMTDVGEAIRLYDRAWTALKLH
ncbi:ABC transporter substrate-binding protein [Nitrospira sp. Kam-Ns4a]